MGMEMSGSPRTPGVTVPVLYDLSRHRICLNHCDLGFNHLFLDLILAEILGLTSLGSHAK